MLNQLFFRAIRRVPSSTTSKSCIVCSCNCGTKFLPDTQQNTLGASSSTQRHYATKRRSPAVRRAQRDQEKKPLTVEERKRTHEYGPTAEDYLQGTLRNYGFKQEDISAYIAFVGELHDLAESSPAGQVQLDLKAFEALLAKYPLVTATLFVARVMLSDKRPATKNVARRLLFTLSHLGDAQATIYIGFQALKQHRRDGRSLNSPDLVGPRAFLRKSSELDSDYLAKTLEGRIAYQLGDHERAIDLWTRAIEPAAAVAEVPEQRSDTGHDVGTGSNVLASLDLDSPWIELANAHSARNEHDKALWAIEKGTRADDPISHYQRAQYEKEPGKIVGTTSTWYYHTSKAAASGYVKAMHEMGIFYFTTGWKYFSDEPPDSVKPTPFDSYPSGFQENLNPAAVFQSLGKAFGVSSPPEADPKNDMFHTAVFPTTPEKRMQTALMWFELCMDLFYAPSYLSAARLYLEEKLWSESETPQSALNMTASRYEYASKSDFIAKKKKESTQSTKGDPPNPFYSTEKARKLIREVLYAANAQRERRIALSETARSLGRSADSRLVANHRTNEVRLSRLHEDVRKWSRYPAIRDLCSNDELGVLFDQSSRIPDLEKEAMELCEQQKWDIYDNDGGLLYRHGLKPAREPSIKSA